MTELEKLIAIEAIKQLKAQRVRALDTRDWETYELLHAPEHVSYGLKGGTPAAGPKAMMERLKKQLENVDQTVHMVHTPEITITSPDTAAGKWLLEDRLFWRQGEEEHWYRGYGLYDETYVKRDGRWLFTSRKIMRLRVDVSPGGISPID